LQLQGIKLDIPMLIEYFKIPDEQKKKKKKGAREEKKQLLDLKRANHIGLLMSMLKMGPKDIGEALMKCKAEKFTEDNIKGMLKLLPSDQDVQMLKEFMNAPPEVVNTLGPPEQFYLEIMRIPRLESRLRTFLFKSQFVSNITRLKEDIAACHHGVKVMKENKLLGLFLELILSIGNFLNQGTATGDCFGFRVDVLPKLKDTKSPVKTEYSLLHYIAYFAEKKKPKMLALPGQLVPISKATAEYVTSISLESAEMRGQMTLLQKELDTVARINEEAPEKDPYEKVMGKFFSEAKTEIGDMITNCEALMADNKALYAWYCGTKEMCLSSIFIEFARDFENAVRQNQEREERLAKAATKKKRKQVKAKSTKTSTKKKGMFNDGDEEGGEDSDEGTESSSGEEIVEEIIEESGEEGSGDEVIEEIVEEYSESE